MYRPRERTSPRMSATSSARLIPSHHRESTENRQHERNPEQHHFSAPGLLTSVGCAAMLHTQMLPEKNRTKIQEPPAGNLVEPCTFFPKKVQGFCAQNQGLNPVFPKHYLNLATLHFFGTRCKVFSPFKKSFDGVSCPTGLLVREKASRNLGNAKARPIAANPDVSRWTSGGQTTRTGNYGKSQQMRRCYHLQRRPRLLATGYFRCRRMKKAAAPRPPHHPQVYYIHSIWAVKHQ